MKRSHPHILIAGAGIGGLICAIALARSGAKVEIFEATSALSAIGAGLQLSANAMHVLKAIDLDGAIKTAGFEPQRAVMREHLTGKALLTVPLKGAHHSRYGQDYLHIHRADLHSLLVRAAREVGVNLHLGARAAGYTQDESQITMTTDEGGAFKGDILIGADGIKSEIREQMLGPTKPQFTGQTAWRGLIPASALPQNILPKDATVWLGPGAHFVSYYVRGGELINFVAVKEQQAWTQEGWAIEGDMEQLRQAYAGWDSRITTLLSACETCHLWGLFDHPPLPRWTDGRAALLGDAAHPMLPFMAQGAAMAIEDGYELAKQVLNGGDMASALTTYEELRKPRTSKLQAISRANAKLYHLDGAVSKAARAAKFKLAQIFPALAHSQFDPIYGYDATKI